MHPGLGLWRRERSERSPRCHVWRVSQTKPPHPPPGLGPARRRCQGTRWRPTVKGAVWGGLGAACTYSEALAPLKPRRCQFPGLRSSNRLLALGSSLLVEISSTYFSDDVTHSDFLHFESWYRSKTFREASEKKNPKKSSSIKENQGVLWGDGEEEERGSCLLILRFAAACECHSPASFLAAEGGQWPGVGDVRARPESSPAARLPCHSEGDKRNLWCPEALLSGHSPVRAAGQNIPAASPPPAALPTSGTVPGRFSKASSGDIALLHGRGKATLWQRSSSGGGVSGDFSLHPLASPTSHFPVVPPYPGNRRGLKRVRERWKVFLSPSLDSAQCSGSILCPCALTLHLCTLTSGYQYEFVLPGFKGSSLFKRGIYIPVPATGCSKRSVNTRMIVLK